MHETLNNQKLNWQQFEIVCVFLSTRIVCCMVRGFSSPKCLSDVRWAESPIMT